MTNLLSEDYPTKPQINLQKIAFVAAAAALPFLAFAIQGTMDLNLADEGFLWYGAQRVMEGEVPFRDFQSYDIGRYYWAAGIMSLIGSKGVLALRISNAVLLSVTMALAAYLVAWKSTRIGVVSSLMIVSAFVLWLIPDFKAADFFAPVILVFGIAYLIDRPSTNRYFLCGVAVGFAAVIGRNHGLYGVIGSFSAIAYLRVKRNEMALGPLFLAWCAGVLVGYLPTIVALLFVPGFSAPFFDLIRVFYQHGTTNLTLPMPWPWLVKFQGSIPWFLHFFLISLGLLFLPCFAVVSMSLMFFRKSGGGNP